VTHEDDAADASGANPLQQGGRRSRPVDPDDEPDADEPVERYRRGGRCTSGTEAAERDGDDTHDDRGQQAVRPHPGILSAAAGPPRTRRVVPRHDDNARVDPFPPRFLVHQLIQVVGALLILSGFVLAQVRVLDPQSLPYLVVNLLGSAILTVDAWRQDQWGFFLLEGVWAIVSAWG
jgi:hypothetical protein